MKRLAKIFKKYGRPKQTSASCLYVEGLEIPVAEAMARDLKAANFFPCVVYYKKGNR